MKPDKDITIYYIARKLELSSASVIRGLSNNPSVKKNTRKTIVLVPANLNRNVYAGVILAIPMLYLTIISLTIKKGY